MENLPGTQPLGTAGYINVDNENFSETSIPGTQVSAHGPVSTIQTSGFSSEIWSATSSATETCLRDTTALCLPAASSHTSQAPQTFAIGTDMSLVSAGVPSAGHLSERPGPLRSTDTVPCTGIPSGQSLGTGMVPRYRTIMLPRYRNRNQ